MGYAVLGGSRRRLDGVGLGYLFLDASHFEYRAGAAAELVLRQPCLWRWQSRPSPA